jgi:hypothetical protein
MSALASLLVRDQIVSVRKIEEAIQRQVISGGELDTVLLELEAVPEDTLAAYRAAVYALPVATRQEVTAVVADTVALVPREVAERHRLIPLGVEGRSLAVAVAKPLGKQDQEQLGFLLGFDLSPRIATEPRITMALVQHYGLEMPPRMRRLQKKLDARDPGAVPFVKPPEANRLAPERLAVAPKDREPEQVLSDPPPAEGRTTKRFGVLPASAPPPEPAAQADAPRPDAASAPAPAVAEPSPEPQRVVVGVSRVVGVGAPAAPTRQAPAAEPAAAEPEPSPILAELAEPPSASKAMELLGRARTRDEILETLFAHARGQFHYTALFVVHDEVAEGRNAAGEGGASGDEVRRMAVPLDVPSSFAEARRSAGPKVTRFDSGKVDATVVAELGRSDAQPSLLLPITIRQRVVLMLYGDRGGEELGFGDVPDLLALASQVGGAFERLIVQRKFRGYASAEQRSGEARVQPDKLAMPARPSRPSRQSWESPAPASPAAAQPVARAPDPGSPPPAAEQAPAPAPPADAPVPPRAAPPPRGARGMPSARRTVMGLPAVDGPEADRWGAQDAVGGGPVAPSAGGATPQAPDKASATPRPSAFTILGVPRSAPPPPGMEGAAPGPEADEWTPRDTVREMPRFTEPGPEPAGPAPAAEPADDEPELTVEYGDEDDAELAALEDYEPEAASVPDGGSPTGRRQDPRRDDPDGAPAEDVVRLGRASAAAAAAIHSSRPPPSGSQPPPDPDPEQPSVIVDMGQSVEALVRDLSLSGPDDGGAAVQRVLSQGEAVLPALVQHFPGPLWFDRHRPYRRLPAGRDVSPIARALDAFGERAVPYVVTLLGAHQGDTRFYAVLLAADLPHPDLIEPLSRLAFDPDPGVRARALEALPRFARFPGPYDEVLEGLRVYARVPRKSPERRAQTVEALGHLRDVRALDLLIQCLDDDEPATAAAARRSLVMLTRQDFGEGSKRWAAWLDKNRDRHRIEWLIDALNHPDEALRGAAGEELQQLTQQYHGFHPQLSKREREVMQRRYREWWTAEGAASIAGEPVDRPEHP